MVESVGSRTASAVRQATLRLSLRAGFLEKREKWRTPSYSGSVLKNKSAFYFAVKVAHPPARAVAERRAGDRVAASAVIMGMGR
jgi:hypothetical protein